MLSSRNKYIRNILLVLLASLMIMGLVACRAKAQSQANDPTGTVASAPLTVLSMIGSEVLVMKPGDTDWIRAEQAIVLDINYKIKTGAGGSATITFFDGSTIDLQGGTEIALSELIDGEKADTIKIKQTVGKTLSTVQKLADPASRYEIETPSAIAAVRGTTLYVGVAQDGTTVVGNVEGTVVVIVAGVVTSVEKDTRVTVPPGSPAGSPQPGAIPEDVNPPTSTPTPTPKPEPASLTMSRAFDPQLIYNGDPITLSYTVVNTGKRPVSEIALKDDKAGAGAYSSGDANTNKAIDPGETWLFKANYTVPTTQMGPLQTNAEVIGKDPDGQPVNCAASTSINITLFHLTLNLPSQAEVINSITMTGSVNDPTVKEVTLDHNGRLRQVPVVDGVFSATIVFDSGTNKLTFSATRSTGAKSSTTINFIQK